MWRSLSADEVCELRYVNLFTNFRELRHRVEIAPSHMKANASYAIGIRLGQVYLQEALDHLHGMHLL